MKLLDLTIVTTALIVILSRPGMTGSMAGFMLGFAQSISNCVNWILLYLRDFEVRGVSLERTSEYCKLEREDGKAINPEVQDQQSYEAFVTEDTLKGWPSKGLLEVTNLSASYGPDLPDILHNISFQVEGGQRVGIVGATGGGKSTLAKAFFSFVDITNGCIKIDGRGESQRKSG